MLRSSEAPANEVLNEHPVIALDDETWDDFVTEPMRRWNRTST